MRIPWRNCTGDRPDWPPIPLTWASPQGSVPEGLGASAFGNEVRGLVAGTNLALIEQCCFA